MQPISQLVARDIMHADPISATPEQLLAEVRHLLIESHIGGMPVVSKGRLVGIISRSDLVRMEELVDTLDNSVSEAEVWQDNQADGFRHAPPEQFHGFQKRLEKLCVRDAMRAQVLTCLSSTPVADVASQMVRNHVHRIVVVEGDRPVGIISSLDLASLVARGATPE